MSLLKPSGSNKRKISDEHRQFHENWELQYFCSKIINNVICLICKSVAGVPKLYNIKRHYEQHKSKYDQYKGIFRLKNLKEYKSGYKHQHSKPHKTQCFNDISASYTYCLVSV